MPYASSNVHQGFTATCLHREPWPCPFTESCIGLTLELYEHLLNDCLYKLNNKSVYTTMIIIHLTSDTLTHCDVDTLIREEVLER